MEAYYFTKTRHIPLGNRPNIKAVALWHFPHPKLCAKIITATLPTQFEMVHKTLSQDCKTAIILMRRAVAWVECQA
jgi:hypothetical protein